ncbi:MAG: bifunctional 4-hydroxy-2-oxoglutarate aldolase/2-dehydro-3-deoxy-phosphogluconate aldolase [Candidatus Limnocylindrales bacterium]
MTDRPAIPDLVRQSKVIAIGRNVPAADVPRVGEALVAGGVHIMELTLNQPEDAALRSIEALAAVADDLDALVGAGTVLSIGAAKRAVDAGARFIVSPHTDTELIAWCALNGVPCYPGALSPTEIHAAWAAGASAVKLFPASAVGTGYLKQIAGPFPDIEFIPTGGVSAETAGDWIAAGAVAVGMGGWLIGDGQPAGISERSRAVVAAVTG